MPGFSGSAGRVAHRSTNFALLTAISRLSNLLVPSSGWGGYDLRHQSIYIIWVIMGIFLSIRYSRLVTESYSGFLPYDYSDPNMFSNLAVSNLSRILILRIWLIIIRSLLRTS